MAALYLAGLAAERLALDLCRRRLRLVVHVNGTRGKSETTRLVAAALRAGGLRTVAKTTGTEARLILPDGSERRLRRLGAPNVREQRNLILYAARLGAEAVVAECMAVSPEAQEASTAFLAPSILAVTNARPDHGLELGGPAQAALAFAAGVPDGGVAVTADPALLPALEAAALERGARAVLAEPVEGTAARFAQNAGLALAVALEAGVPRRAALEGMSGFAEDPGAAGLRLLPREGAPPLPVIDALAANDVVSTEAAFAACEARAPGLGAAGPKVLLLAFRADRPDRSLEFARWAAGSAGRWDAVIAAGHCPAAASRELARSFPGKDAEGRARFRKVGPRAALAALATEPEAAAVWAAGNWKGLGPALAAAAPREAP